MTELSPGDSVIFTDVDGNTFSYAVAVSEVLSPTDYEEMVAGEFELTLFDCTIGGASRYTVRCTLL